MARFTAITEEAFKANAKRGDELRPYALSANFDRTHHRVVVHLNTGLHISFDPGTACGLDKANARELSEIEVVGAGGAIHFTQLNAFFSIPRLLEGFLGPMSWARSEARAAASRKNGALGGRPKKIPALT